MTTTLIIHVLLNLAFCAVGFYLGNRQNRARMTKLASSNIDLIASVDGLKKDIDWHWEQRSAITQKFADLGDRYSILKQENEALKFQLEQSKIS